MSNQDLPYHVSPSLIHGIGAFATRLIRKGEVIPMPRALGFPFFPGFNHSCDPNLGPHEEDDVRHTLRDISQGEEITVSYGRLPIMGQVDTSRVVIATDQCRCQIHRGGKI